MATRLTWRGDELKRRAQAAAEKGIDKTMSEASIEAKQNHPGWKNVTGTAEGSVRPVRFAETRAGKTSGIWGSQDVNYMIWLELKHGSALRAAADRIYPRLAGHIREAFRA